MGEINSNTPKTSVGTLPSTKTKFTIFFYYHMVETVFGRLVSTFKRLFSFTTPSIPPVSCHFYCISVSFISLFQSLLKKTKRKKKVNIKSYSSYLVIFLSTHPSNCVLLTFFFFFLIFVEVQDLSICYQWLQ